MSFRLQISKNRSWKTNMIPIMHHQKIILYKRLPSSSWVKCTSAKNPNQIKEQVVSKSPSHIGNSRKPNKPGSKDGGKAKHTREPDESFPSLEETPLMLSIHSMFPALSKLAMLELSVLELPVMAKAMAIVTSMAKMVSTV